MLDFGIALVERSDPDASAGLLGEPAPSHLTQSGTTVGTVAYMSPEQARGERLDGRSDLFSLGVLMYEMASGLLPFQGDTSASVLEAIAYREPVPVRTLRPGLPLRLDEMISTALTKDRHGRVPSAGALRDQLKALKHELESAELLSHPPRRAPPSSGTYLLASMAVLALVLLASGIIYVRSAGRSATGVRSLVVLPFENGSVDSAQSYFASGMTEAVATQLSQIGALRVIRSSRQPLAKLTRELHAGLAIDGSATRAGEQVQLSAKVFDLTDGHAVWSKHYRSGMEDVLTLQAELVREVVDVSGVRVTAPERAALSRPRSITAASYESYLRGRQLLNRQTASDLRQAAEQFRRSIDFAPRFAPAYAGLADSYCLLAWFGAVRPLDVLDSARAAAHKAQLLEPGLAEGQISAGLFSGFFDWDWPAAEKDLKEALRVNPSLADGHHWYAHLLEATGRPNEGLAELKRAHELDALYPLIEQDIALSYFYRRDYNQALAEVRKMLEVQPDFWRVHVLLGNIYREQRLFPAAIGELERAYALSNSNLLTYAQLGRAYAAAGRDRDARQILEKLLARSQKSYVDLQPLAEIYLALGQKEQGLQLLETACANHVPRLPWMVKRDPVFDGVRTDPRFKGLLGKMRLSS